MARTSRYVREWPAQQTIAGILSVADTTQDAKGRRFRLYRLDP